MSLSNYAYFEELPYIAKINNYSTTGLDIASHISDPGDHGGPIRYAGGEKRIP
jgi:hypothetical protein